MPIPNTPWQMFSRLQELNSAREMGTGLTPPQAPGAERRRNGSDSLERTTPFGPIRRPMGVHGQRLAHPLILPAWVRAPTWVLLFARETTAFLILPCWITSVPHSF